MRVVFKLPGKASVDALTSFVCSPAVGVMVTSNLYKGNAYTAKESVSITTSFSFVSLGAYAFLSGLAGCEDYYSVIILCSLLLAFVVAAIMIRIPPISEKGDTFYNGSAQTQEQRKPQKLSTEIFVQAYRTALEKCRKHEAAGFINAFTSSMILAARWFLMLFHCRLSVSYWQITRLS